MSGIQILSPFVADLIAAGEVVEHPASVVKELVENSLDAGAKNIVVELRGSGRSFIRVTDDGCGMSPEDAGIAFLRHATSKLRDARGLEAIATLGFRGEALSAISAVSRVELLTRERGAGTGVYVALQAGEITQMYETGCPEGTTLTVRDLFFNTPARLKFMGSDRAEGARCVAAALRCALGRPDVSFRCIKDGNEEFFTPGDGRTDSCVYSLLGRETARSLLPCSTDDGVVRVHGYISSPAACRGNRSGQYFFVNGRHIRSKSLQAALEQAYKNTSMTGRFPACVLYIELSPASVDVNVHPAKTEVKFSDEKRVFDGVYYAAKAALDRENRFEARAPAGAAPPGEPAPAGFSPRAGAVKPREDFFRSMRAEEFSAESVSQKALKNAGGRKTAAPIPPAGTGAAPLFRDAGMAYASGSPGVRRAAPAPPAPKTAPQAALDESFHRAAPRLAGEALGVYILVEQGDQLILIDKHAAHERILFDRMRLADEPLMSQSLLAPVVYSPGGEGAELLSNNRELLEKLGFELEPYGAGAVILRAVPADLDAEQALPVLEELTEKLREGRKLDAGDIRDRLADTIACKAAVKAGKSSDPSELLALAAHVLSGEIKYCPHGRPVSVVLTRAELDKRFGRTK